MKQLFYWGVDTPSNWVPNRGPLIGGARLPLWVSSTSILSVSSALINGVGVSGIFAIAVDSVTFEYCGFESYEYSERILALEHEPVDGTAILLEQTATGDAQVTNCRLTNGEVVRLRVLVQEDCHPTAVTTLAGGEGIVFAGTPPGTTVYGLYWRRWAAPSSYTDSLLVGLGPGFVPPNCMDALSDGTGLVFGLQDGLGFNATTRYLEHELMAGGTSELLLARPGQPISVRSNPVAPQQVALSHYAAASGDLGSSGTAILLLDRGNHTTTELNTRTSLNACLSPLYGTADWSPRATELLLPSGAVDHAGSPFPTPLWVLVGVSQ